MNTIGRYTVVQRLGMGGMAEVFLAKDAGAGGAERLVVVKQILPQLVEDETFVTMFLNEARIAAQLSHPNIAHVYEVGEHAGRTFIAMEFVHGADLNAILKRRDQERLSPPLSALIVARAAAALHHAHHLCDLSGRPLKVVH